MIKIDFHIHSCYSKDSLLKPAVIVEILGKKGIDAFALTDHNNIDGIEEAAKISSLKFIAGEEIKSSEGEIIGLFLKEKISPKLSPEKTVELIKEQEGLVYVPHPFDRWRKSRLDFNALERIRKDIDIIEVFNARTMSPSDNGRAEDYAARYNIPMGVGSDSHTACELGNCYVEIEDFSSPKELVQALKNGRRVTKLSSPLVHFGSTYSKVRKRISQLLGK